MNNNTIRDQAAYVARVCEAIAANDDAVFAQLSPVCPDCGEEAADTTPGHVIINAWVLVGCEGAQPIEI